MENLSSLCSEKDTGYKSRVREMQYCYFENGEKRLKAKACGWLLEAGKGEERHSSLEPPGKNAAMLTLCF